MWQYGSGQVWQKGYWGYHCLTFKTCKILSSLCFVQISSNIFASHTLLCKTLNIQQFNSKVRQMMTIFSFLLRNVNVINMMMGIVFHVLCVRSGIFNTIKIILQCHGVLYYLRINYSFRNRECLCQIWTARGMSTAYVREIAIWCPVSKCRLEISNDFNCITGPGNNNNGSDFLFLYSHQSRPGHDVSAGNSPRSALSLSPPTPDAPGDRHHNVMYYYRD